MNQRLRHRAVASSPTRFHWLRLRTTCHATEDPDRVAAAIHTVAADPEQTMELDAVPIDSHHGGEVILMELELKRAREIRAALAGLDDATKAQVDARMDEDGVFYFRFDKQAAYQGRCEPTRGDDAVHGRVKVEVHPAGRDRAVAALEAFFATE